MVVKFFYWQSEETSLQFQKQFPEHPARSLRRCSINSVRSSTATCFRSNDVWALRSPKRWKKSKKSIAGSRPPEDPVAFGSLFPGMPLSNLSLSMPFPWCAPPQDTMYSVHHLTAIHEYDYVQPFIVWWMMHRRAVHREHCIESAPHSVPKLIILFLGELIVSFPSFLIEYFSLSPNSYTLMVNSRLLCSLKLKEKKGQGVQYVIGFIKTTIALILILCKKCTNC